MCKNADAEIIIGTYMRDIEEKKTFFFCFFIGFTIFLYELRL